MERFDQPNLHRGPAASRRGFLKRVATLMVVLVLFLRMKMGADLFRQRESHPWCLMELFHAGELNGIN